MKAYEGRFNYRNGRNAHGLEECFDPPELAKLSAGHSPTVDGAAIRYCWYADTQEGVVKAYIKSDGTPGHELVASQPDLAGREMELLDVLFDGKYLLSETHRGKVEIWGDGESTG